MKFTQGNLSRKDRRRLAQAKKIAATSDCGHMHGCVATVGGRVVGVGVNRYKNSMSLFDHTPRFGWSVHAEEACLKSIGGDAQGAVVYIARINRRGEEMMSKPCSSCMEKLQLAGVKRIVYTIDSSVEF